MTVKLLAEQHLEFVSLKGGCRGSSESTLVKMPHFWKSYVTAQYSVMLGMGHFLWLKPLLKSKAPLLKRKAPLLKSKAKVFNSFARGTSLPTIVFYAVTSWSQVPHSTN